MYSSNILEEASIVLDKMLPIEENTEYYPELVPVFEDYEHATNIIRIEDLVEYATSNNITDGTDAITSICEANKVLPETISLSVNESNLFTDIDMLDSARYFKESGFDVYINPISKSDLAYIYTEAVFKGINEYNKESVLEAYAEDDLYFLKEMFSHQNSYPEFKKAMYNIELKANNSSIVSDWIGKKFSSLRRMKYSFMDKLKASSSPLEKKDLSMKIDLLNDTINKLKEKLKNK